MRNVVRLMLQLIIRCYIKTSSSLNMTSLRTIARLSACTTPVSLRPQRQRH